MTLLFIGQNPYIIKKYKTQDVYKSLKQQLMISHTTQIQKSFEGKSIAVPVTIALSVSKEENIITIDECNDLPKLYIFLPLIGSEQFMLPIVTHSPMTNEKIFN